MNNLTKDYFESLIFESFKIDQILDSLVNKNYPEPKVKVFIEKDLIPINQLLREQLEKLILESKDNSPEVLAAKNAWDYFCRITRIVGAADIRSSPIEVIRVIDFWLKGMEGNYLLLVTPMNELNYSFQEIWLPFSDFLKNYLDYDRAINYSVINLCFPVNEKDNVFLLPIYAHEMGHFLDRRNRITERVIKKNVTTIPSVIKSMVKKVTSGETKPVDEVIALTVVLDAFLRNWIEEIVADTFGIYLSGPAFLFASRSFDAQRVHDVISKGLRDQVSQTHPTNRLRSIYRWRLLKDSECFLHLPDELREKAKEYVEFWSKPSYSHKTIQYWTHSGLYLVEFNEGTLKECEDYILSLKCDIVSAISSVLGETRVLEGELIEEVPGLVERLSKVIPPNETSDGKPVSPNAIMNVAWITKLESKERIKREVGRLSFADGYAGDFEVEEIIKNLSRYAIMVSDVQRKWEE